MSAIKIRNEKTISIIEKLTSELGMNTKTGLIDYVVSHHTGLAETVNFQEKNISSLEDELRSIKTIIREKKHADEQFKTLCDSLTESNDINNPDEEYD